MTKGIILSALITIIIVAAGYFLLSKQKQSSADVQKTATDIAANISASLSPYIKKVDVLANSKTITDLFKRGDIDLLRKEAAKLLPKMQPALKLLLFLPDDYELNTDDIPPLGFASLILLKRAESSTSPLAVEAHLFGTSDEHIVIVRRVKDEQNNLIGLVHVSLPVNILEDAIFNDPPKKQIYAEIQQALTNEYTVLIKYGDSRYSDSDLRTKTPVGHAKIENTRWHVFAWP